MTDLHHLKQRVETVAGDANLKTLIRDIRPYVERPIGTLRIDMDDVRSIVAMYDAILSLPALSFVKGDCLCPPSASPHRESSMASEASRYVVPPYEFEVWQDDMPVASAIADDREAALREARGYFAQYRQDGPVELYEVRRTLLQHSGEPETLGALRASEASDVTPNSTSAEGAGE